YDPPPRRRGQLMAGEEALGDRRDEGVDEPDDAGRLGHRRLRIRDADLERPEARVGPKLPPPQARLGDRSRAGAPAQLLRETVPAVERRRHALPWQQLGDLRADGCQAGVPAVVEPGVGAEGREL